MLKIYALKINNKQEMNFKMQQRKRKQTDKFLCKKL